MSLATINPSSAVQVDQAAILRALNLNPNDPKTQALLLVCEKYGLDPLMKHMVLISGNPYVTRDGYLHVAHSSGVFDGMEVTDEGASDTHWWAKVSVYRKDMGRAFTYTGRYPKSGQMSSKYGPEMAIKCAEVMALRRAFDVTGVGAADEQWDAITVEALDPATESARDDLRDAIAELTDGQAMTLKAWWKAEKLPKLELLDAEQINYVAAQVVLLRLREDRRPDDGGLVSDDHVGDTGHAADGGDAAEGSRPDDVAPPLTVGEVATVEHAGPSLPASAPADEGAGAALPAASAPPKRTPASGRKATTNADPASSEMRSKMHAVVPKAFPFTPDPGDERTQNAQKQAYHKERLYALCAAMGRPIESRKNITDDYAFCDRVIKTLEAMERADLYLTDGVLVDADGNAVAA